MRTFPTLHAPVIAARVARPVAPSAVLRAIAVGQRLIELSVAMALALDVAVVFTAVLFRYLLNSPIHWSEEVARLLLLYLSFVGSALALRRGQHMGVTAFVSRLAPAQQAWLQGLVVWLVILFSTAAMLNSIPLIALRWSQKTYSLGWSQALFILPLTLGTALMVVYGLVALARLPGRQVLTWGVLLAALGGIGWAVSQIAPGLIGGISPLALTLPVFVLTFAINVPIGFALGLCSLTYLLVEGQPVSVLSQRVASGVDSFVLLAVPFFVLAGMVMDRGGMSRRLVEFVRVLVGHIRGGLGLVMIVSMYLFSGISGSKTADIAAVGSLLVPSMKRHGYDPGEAVSILAASAAMGETVPPSIAMLLLGSITSLSIGALFVAGVIPAAVVAVVLGVAVFVRAARFGTGRRPSLAAVWHALGGSILALLMPVLIFGGILLGIATPTEVSAFAVGYALLVALVIYREMRGRELVELMVDAATLTGMILFIIGTATVLAWILTVRRLPQDIAELMQSATGGPALFMALSLVVLVVMGALLEGLPALIIFGPLLLPVAESLGINPLHYGIVLIIAMGVGAFSPPLGIGLYVACSVGKTSIEQVTRPMLVYVLVLLLGLLVVAYVPELTLFLPRQLGMGS